MLFRSCVHIDNSTGAQFPPGGIHDYWRRVREGRGKMEPEPAALGVVVGESVGVGERIG